MKQWKLRIALAVVIDTLENSNKNFRKCFKDLEIEKLFPVIQKFV